MDIPKHQRMADQIAMNFAFAGRDEAVASTADHIDKFWEPRMKAGIFESNLDELSEIARDAIKLLMAKAEA